MARTLLGLPVEKHGRGYSKPTVKQHLAAIRMLFDYLVTGGVLVRTGVFLRFIHGIPRPTDGACVSAGWASDNRSVYVPEAVSGKVVKVVLLDKGDGQLFPQRPLARLKITPHGRAYAYDFRFTIRICTSKRGW